MHSSDKQLQLLLTVNEKDTQLDAIAGHVEGCSRCQRRLQELSGEGQWTSELVGHLRKPVARDLLAGSDAAPNGTSTSAFRARTVVLAHPSDALENEVEFDPISLDFLEDPVHPELLGRLGRYDIESIIGAGGMGVVLKGFDGDLHRPVAIKVLAPHLAHNAAARKRFAREAQAVAAVIHPHVIPIFNVEVEQRFPFLVMSLVDGPSLQTYVDAHGPLPIDVALRIAQQTAIGLAAAHAQGLIHRDVKPANILLDGNLLRVVLSDFGLARMVDDASMTRTGIVTGTPHYMSPEQAGGETIDCRSDLFSLGCVLWFMLTGRTPFRAATAMGVLNKICHAGPGDLRELNPHVPQPLADIVTRLLNKSADHRFANAIEVEQSLGNCLADWQSGKFQRPQRKKPVPQLAMLVGALCLCLAVISSSLWLLFGMPTSFQPTRFPTSSFDSERQPNYAASDKPTEIPTVPLGLSGPSFKQQLQTDPWYQQLARLTQDVDQLEDGGRQQTQAWLQLSNSVLSPEASVEPMRQTLDDLEKDLKVWRELLESPPETSGSADKTQLEPAD